MQVIKCFRLTFFVKSIKIRIYSKFNVVHNIVRANFSSLLESLTLGMFWKLHWPDKNRYFMNLKDLMNLKMICTDHLIIRSIVCLSYMNKAWKHNHRMGFLFYIISLSFHDLSLHLWKEKYYSIFVLKSENFLIWSKYSLYCHSI